MLTGGIAGSSTAPEATEVVPRSAAAEVAAEIFGLAPISADAPAVQVSLPFIILPSKMYDRYATSTERHAQHGLPSLY